MTTTIYRQSTIFVRSVVQATLAGQPYNPTSDDVFFAFLSPAAQPVSGTTWTSGSWDSGVPYTARCLVGPENGGLDLAAGRYSVWVKIADSPEIPVLPAGVLVVQ